MDHGGGCVWRRQSVHHRRNQRSGYRLEGEQLISWLAFLLYLIAGREKRRTSIEASGIILAGDKALEEDH